MVEVRSMNTRLMVSRSYEDVPMRARWEESGKVDFWVIRVVKQEKPVLAFLGEPGNRVVRRFTYLIRKRYVRQAGVDSLSCARIDEEYI